MYKLILPAAALVALAFSAATADNASAKGFHFAGGGVHVDVGYPHGGYRTVGYHSGGFGHGCGYGGGYGGGWGWGGGHTWHDTSHWDYHPTEWRPHGNHWHVQPGHWDWHQEGHLDHQHP